MKPEDTTPVGLGEKVVLSIWDAVGAGHKLAAAFCTEEEQQPSLALHRRRATHLELSLNSYGLADQKVTLLIWTFSTHEGIPKVSIIKVLEQIKPISCACVAHAILKFIVEEAAVQSSPPFVIIPSASVLPNYLENNADNGDPSQFIWFSFFNNSENGKVGHNKLKELPLSMEVGDEFLGSLLHLVNIMEVRAFLLLMPFNRLGSLDDDLAERQKNQVNEVNEMIFYLGGVLEKELGLSFSPKFLEVSITKSLDQEIPSNGADWRSLYI